MSQCTLERHRAEIRELLRPLFDRLVDEAELLPLDTPGLPGRVIAREHVARTPVPAFDNSQMDGYAVRSTDLATASSRVPVELPIARATAAGDPPLVHSPGTASPVMTGAVIPEGADAVVPVEEGSPDAFPPLARSIGEVPAGRVAFDAPVAPGRFIRRRAEDIETGAVVAEAGSRITPSLIGALAATGVDHVAIRPRPRVLLCSTGDELAEVGESLPPGRIHDANTPMMCALLTELGADVSVLRTGDTAEELRQALLAAFPAADLVVTSGGISRGAFEVVREAFEPLGLDFHPVAIQPGGPQGFGVLGEHDVPVLCFPGNPVSAALSCELFLAPVLRRLLALPPDRKTLELPLAHEVLSPAGKHQIRRGRIDENGRVVASGPGSHLIGELAASQLLVHLPIGVERAPEGSLVETWRFND